MREYLAPSPSMFLIDPDGIIKWAESHESSGCSSCDHGDLLLEDRAEVRLFQPWPKKLMVDIALALALHHAAFR